MVFKDLCLVFCGRALKISLIERQQSDLFNFDQIHILISVCYFRRGLFWVRNLLVRFFVIRLIYISFFLLKYRIESFKEYFYSIF